MKHILLLVFALFSVHLMMAQQGQARSFSIQVHDCSVDKSVPVDGAKEIEARFAADKKYGPAPLTVSFTDRSTGGAAAWLWRFGDGDTAYISNPVHTFQHEGKYNVKVSVWNADSTSVDVATAEIRVVGYGVCDSVFYNIPGNYYWYRLAAPGTGYLSGNNSRGDLAKASHFSINEDKGMLMAGLFYFAEKTNNFASNPPIYFYAWDNDGPDGGPGTVLDSAKVLLSDILIDEFGTGIFPVTIAFFDDWVNIDHDFYMGVKLPQTPGDTVALYTNKNDDTSDGNGWEQTSTGEWKKYKDANPGYDVDNAIFPIVCQATGISNPILNQEVLVYPVPASDRIFVVLTNPDLRLVTASLSDISGRMVMAPVRINASGSTIDVSRLNEGLYILRLDTDDGFMVRKIIVE